MDIHKQNSTLLILIHEIYGLNRHILGFSQALSNAGFDVICPNLLAENTVFDYSQEGAAYANFMDNVGFINAADKIKRIIADNRKKYTKIYVIGWSVGATVAWLCSEEKNVDGMICYYGSRIRNYMNIEPSYPALLFFPNEEPSFHVNALVSCLQKKNIETYILNDQHGFSDPYSTNYNEYAAQFAFTKMIEFLER